MNQANEGQTKSLDEFRRESVALFFLPKTLFFLPKKIETEGLHFFNSCPMIFKLYGARREKVSFWVVA